METLASRARAFADKEIADLGRTWVVVETGTEFLAIGDIFSAGVSSEFEGGINVRAQNEYELFAIARSAMTGANPPEPNQNIHLKDDADADLNNYLIQDINVHSLDPTNTPTRYSATIVWSPITE